MRSLYILLLVALPTLVFAQTNFHPGYVVKTNGDTVKGYIDYREWGQNPLSIDFRTNKDDKQTQQFTPESIKGFQVTGMDTYISYSGPISNDRNHFPDLPGKLDTSKVQASVFLKQLAAGNYISLYNHIDENKTRYFIAEANTAPVELKYYQYYNDQHDAVERSFFRGQLIFYANKYDPANTGLTATAGIAVFDEVPLVSLVNKINGNKGGNANRKSPVRFFVGAGALYTKTRLIEPYFAVATNSGSYYYRITSGSVCTAPQVNFGVDLFINPNVQKLIFRTAVSLSTLSAQLSYPVTLTKNNLLSFDQFTTAVTPQLLYNVYNSDSFKVYIDGGAS